MLLKKIGTTIAFLLEEFLYISDPIATPPNPVDSFAHNGLVELLAIDNTGSFLAWERSNNLCCYSVSRGNILSRSR